MFTETQTAGATEAADTAVPQTASSAPVVLKDEVPAQETPKVLEEVVIEEVSIDGMCGVY